VAFRIQQTDAHASTGLSKQLIAVAGVIAADITPQGVRLLCEQAGLDDAVRTLLKRTVLQ
jgi:hypothetical protein